MAAFVSEGKEEVKERIFKLKGCNDFDEVISASEQVVSVSLFFRDMIAMCEDDDATLVIPNVTGPILKKVLEWAEFHKDDPQGDVEEEEEDRRKRLREEMCDFDKKLLDGMDRDDIFNLILAANYLFIPGLQDLGCKQVANMLKGKTADEIREIFEIEQDMDDQQVAQIREENEWCEEK